MKWFTCSKQLLDQIVFFPRNVIVFGGVSRRYSLDTGLTRCTDLCSSSSSDAIYTTHIDHDQSWLPQKVACTLVKNGWNRQLKLVFFWVCNFWKTQCWPAFLRGRICCLFCIIRPEIDYMRHDSTQQKTITHQQKTSPSVLPNKLSWKAIEQRRSFTQC